MIYEALMKPGSFTVPLRPDMPRSVREKVHPYSSLVITPAPIVPSSQPDSAILVGALYHGTIRARWPHLRGMGLYGWLGDEDLKGRVFAWPTSTAGGIATTTQNLAAWVAAIVQSPLTVGTVTSPGGNHTGTYTMMSRRQALETVCAFYGVEARVKPTMAVDVGTAAVLNPEAARLALKSFDGRFDPEGIGVVADGGFEEDWDDYSNRVWVRSRASMGGAGNPAPWKMPDGNLVQVDRIIDAPEAAPGTETQVALMQLGRFNLTDGRRLLDLRSGARNIRSLVQPGASVRLWDPTQGLVGASSGFSTTMGFPHRDILLRLYGLRWAVREGMGVYVRYWPEGATVPSYLDIGPWVDYEDSDAELEVGSFARRLEEDEATTGGLSPLRTAAMEGVWDDGPAPTGIPGTFQYTHKFRRIGTYYMARGLVRIVAGFPPSGAISFPLATGVTHAALGQRQPGSAIGVNISGTGEPVGCFAEVGADYIIFIRPNGALMGLGNSGAPVTGGAWSAGDTIEWTIQMEVSPA